MANNKPPTPTALDRWRTLALQMAGDLLQQGDCYCTDATKHHRCAVCYAEDAVTLNAHEIENPESPTDQAGDQIRSLLLALRAPGHSESEERAGTCSYATNDLRGAALERAGICFKAPGEMRPQCGCEPAKDNPLCACCGNECSGNPSDWRTTPDGRWSLCKLCVSAGCIGLGDGDIERFPGCPLAPLPTPEKDPDD